MDNGPIYIPCPINGMLRNQIPMKPLGMISLKKMAMVLLVEMHGMS